MNGSNSIGNINSENRVRTVMALNTVPTATNPIVARAMSPSSPGRMPQTGTLKNRTNSGSVTASTMPTNARLEISLPT